jgi:dihydropteroate synthase
MTSWREALSDGARADVDQLVDSGLAVAKSRLQTLAFFPPVPIFANGQGAIMQVAHDPSLLGRKATATEVADDAVEQLKKVRDSARGVALVTSTHLAKERTDAVEVWIEHREGIAVSVILPYQRPTLGGVITFGQLRAFAATRRVWA